LPLRDEDITEAVIGAAIEVHLLLNFKTKRLKGGILRRVLG